MTKLATDQTVPQTKSLVGPSSEFFTHWPLQSLLYGSPSDNNSLPVYDYITAAACIFGDFYLGAQCELYKNNEKIHNPIVHSSTTVANVWQQPKCPSPDEWVE